MKILFVYIVPSGGMETLNRQRCHALVKQGAMCHLLYLRNGPGLQNIKDITTFITYKDEEIKQIINREKYDAIIVSSDYRLLQKIRGFGYKGTLIFEVQGLGEETKANKILQDIKEHVVLYSNAILYPKTSHLIRIIENIYPDIKKFCFHNCIDTNTFTYQPTNKSPEHPIIGWVGRLEKNKNWEAFLKFGYRLLRNNPSVRLWMFLDPTLALQSEKEKFNEMVNGLNLTNRLSIFSNIRYQDMPIYYSRIGDSGGCLCSTSVTEGFGYAVVEAMACRCPVLSTDSDGVRSFIIHNQTGVFFKTLYEAVQQAKKLIANPKLREFIRTNAQKHIQENFTPAQYSQNFIKMLQELK